MIGITKKNSFARSLFFFCILSFCLHAEEVIKTGTLIVSYQTGKQGERLNRIRFLVKSENDISLMYPKGVNYVDDEESKSRTVVIGNLPIGKYSLRFLLPNKDAFFDEISPREFVIHEDETLKIDQKIKISKSPLKVKD